MPPTGSQEICLGHPDRPPPGQGLLRFSQAVGQLLAFGDSLNPFCEKPPPKGPRNPKLPQNSDFRHQKPAERSLSEE